MPPSAPFEYFCFGIGVLLSPLILPSLYAVRYAKEHRRRKIIEPPKAAQRARSLSNAGDRDSQQLQSRLFQLPAELRLLIYVEVLGADVDIHVITIEGRLHSVVCKEPKDDSGDHENRHVWSDCIRKRGPLVGMGGYGIGVLGFVSSCRQAYVPSPDHTSQPRTTLT
jgi:hypothetical protein